ncbi:tagatose-6-phosphate kinase [Paraliobacillus quinghaiensis]|uniref:Tagatose-6-phosphate kinase n=1 Tax=Paraliobacillus quinghaiensis TaxID=470815 RepID=A0A917WNG8_9BACI|nr:1-phosphofructokinase [Paraliobacillus quinghaiensis]GGM18628.1 tagatose-6-phosphate kinase [Paraliobacillus quinghaiensis]
MNKRIVTVTLNPAMDKTITLETFKLGELNRVKQSPLVDPGGKGINVAKVLQGFGANVVATGFIAGESGKKLENKVNQLGIKSDFTEVMDGEVRTNLKVVDVSTNQTTEINEPGFSVTAEAEVLLKNKIINLLDDASFLILSGSLPNGIQADVYQQYIEIAKEKGVKVILDADGLSLKQGIDAQPYAIKPNLFELEQYTGMKLTNTDEIIAAGKNILVKGVELICISLGEDGAIFLTSEEGYHITPMKITPKSVVGAGDSMVATLAYSYLQQYSLVDAAKFSTAAGTVTATKEGTTVCTLDEVENTYSKLQALQLY